MGERIALRVDEAGQRVDRFIAAHSLLSRSAIARLAKEGHVRVDGAAVGPASQGPLRQGRVVDVSDTGRAAARPGIVHRLDKDTSGALVVAKNDGAHLVLARQIQAQKLGKEYL